MSPLARRLRALLRSLARPGRWLLHMLPTRRPRRMGRDTLRRKALAGALAGTLGVLSALPQPAQSAPPGPRSALVLAAEQGDDFSGGEVLAQAQIRGDGLGRLGRAAGARRPSGRLFVEDDPGSGAALAGDGMRALAPQGFGDLMLTGSGIDWLLNTNVAEQPSSASGAFYDAAFAELVAATTADGGLITTTLDDAFDGYKALCVGEDCGCAGPGCGSSALVYGGNEPPKEDNRCPGSDASAPDQHRFVAQTFGQLEVSRKVYVPDNGNFARHLEIVTNTSDQPQSADLMLFGNLGSEDGSRVAYDTTVVVWTSSDDRVVSDADYWVTTMQAFGPDGTSPDPRIGHILGGYGGRVRATNLTFADNQELPSWRYHLDLAPGETAILMSLVTLQPSQAAANARAEQLLRLDTSMLRCMSYEERGLVVNWRLTTTFVPLLRS